MSECCLSPSAVSRADRTLLVELLYLNRDVCTRCRGADDALDAALADASPALQAMGVGVDVRRILVDSEDTARRLHFRTSPTIRINGNDIQPEFSESSCESCGSLMNRGDVDCREWTWRGERYASPPKGLIVEALMRAAALPQGELPKGSYSFPDNLRNFFQNRKSAAGGCGCERTTSRG
jgi:Domain of unknown function (DUF2703)